ncbi:TPA: DUF1007 family protein [Proteus mirabilis]
MCIVKFKYFSWRVCSILMAFCLLMVAPKVLAHPHSFIDMQTTFNTQNDKLIGLTFSWVMDPITSMDILYDIYNAQPESDIWKKQAARLMSNILSQNYFSEFYMDGKKQNFRRIPSHYTLIKEKLRVKFNFDVLFITPLPFANHHFELLTYDPTFYVSMTYRDNTQIILPLEMIAGCEHQLIEPFADESLTEYARSLDTNDFADKDLNLGRSFTQRVQVLCQ